GRVSTCWAKAIEPMDKGEIIKAELSASIPRRVTFMSCSVGFIVNELYLRNMSGALKPRVCPDWLRFQSMVAGGNIRYSCEPSESDGAVATCQSELKNVRFSMQSSRLSMIRA